MRAYNNAIVAQSIYTIKVYDSYDPSIVDFSNTFSILDNSSSISITYPNSGTYYNDNNITINWSTNGNISDVSIQLYEDGYLLYYIVSGTSNDGSYTWNPSSTVDNGCCYKIRVSDYSDSNIYDETGNLYFYD